VSTIVTHLNWGTSYLVHDLYRRFVKPEASEAHYVLVGRLVTAGLMVIAAALTFYLETARAGFTLLLSIGAGTGLLYLLRWYWWRVNAAAEIAAMLGSFVIAVGFEVARRAGMDIAAHHALLVTVGATTVIWLAAAFLGPQTDAAVLRRFYQLVRPAGPGWTQVRADAGVVASPDSFAQALLGWVCGVFFVYAALFGVGAWLMDEGTLAAIWAVVFVCSGAGAWRIVQGFRQTR
jgi:hypothetical protein